jgi:glycosyltransferase involved in cell wall biosynthesis
MTDKESSVSEKKIASAKSIGAICVLIPAFNPDSRLLQLVEKLTASGIGNIIVVNDGSVDNSRHVIEALKKNLRCHVLEHAVNMGKGRALKTGLNFFYLNFQDSPGVVTADADGQHLAEDIIKVSMSLYGDRERMVLGAREFDRGTPLRSLIGNVITRGIFSYLVGVKVSDTQTGLRGIPRKFVPDILLLEGERYEFETNMLIAAKTHNMPIKEERINTIYIENNRSSHFNPLIDSMRIYFLFIRFLFSSSIASVIDMIVFAITYNLITSSIFQSIIAGRLMASVVNFSVNRQLVFHNRDRIVVTVVKYYLLAVIIMMLTYVMTVSMVSYLKTGVILSKILSETLLFLVSFAIQRDFIFQAHKEPVSTRET